MDELVIDDKKYLSTKRDAKVTGYAKDYVGQLCREGRVPARLIGRSWYVLESALQDHRFGEPGQGVGEVKTPEPVPASAASVLPPTWQPVKYEAETEAAAMPRLQRSTEPEEAKETSDISSHQEASVEALNSAWSAWFERQGAHTVVDATGQVEELVAPVDLPEEKPVEESSAEETVPLQRVVESVATSSTDEFSVREADEAADEPVAVPIHAVRAVAEAAPAPKPLQAQTEPAPTRWVGDGARRAQGRVRAQKHHRVLVASLALVAVVFVVLAAFGSGNFDSIATSSGVASALAGVVMVNK